MGKISHLFDHAVDVYRPADGFDAGGFKSSERTWTRVVASGGLFNARVRMKGGANQDLGGPGEYTARTGKGYTEAGFDTTEFDVWVLVAGPLGFTAGRQLEVDLWDIPTNPTKAHHGEASLIQWQGEDVTA